MFMAFATLKADFAALRAGKPGHRFHDHYERKHEQRARRAPWLSWVYVAFALVLITAGIFFSLVPGIPGFVLVIPGLGLLVARFERMAIVLDRIEAAVRSRFDRFRGRGHVAPKPRGQSR